MYIVMTPEQKRKKQLEWYYKNRERQIQKNREWKLKNRERMLAQKKEYHIKNREKIIERKKQYRLLHPEKQKEDRQLPEVKARRNELARNLRRSNPHSNRGAEIQLQNGLNRKKLIKKGKIILSLFIR